MKKNICPECIGSGKLYPGRETPCPKCNGIGELPIPEWFKGNSMEDRITRLEQRVIELETTMLTKSEILNHLIAICNEAGIRERR